MSAIEKERVRQALRDAFPDWRADQNSPPLTHDQCLDMRTKLPSVRKEDLQYFLPQVLEDLLDTHTDKPGNSEDAESVVAFLDIAVVRTDTEIFRGHWKDESIERIRAIEEDLRSLKPSATANITATQANAIYEWLKYARTWADLEWDIDQVDSAASYWKARSQADQTK